MKASHLLAASATVIVIGLGVGFVIAGGDTQNAAGLEKNLSTRVERFYGAYSEGRFEEVWNHFGSAMRRDNPKDQAVPALRGMFKGIVPAGSPDLKITPGVRGKTPSATVTTPVIVRTTDGDTTTATHTTYWSWQPPEPKTSPNWFLLGDELWTTEKQRSQLPSVFRTGAPR